MELKKVIDTDYSMQLSFQSKYSIDTSETEKDEGKQQNSDPINSIKASKIKVRQEATYIGKVLSGVNFVNFHLLHPAL